MRSRCCVGTETNAYIHEIPGDLIGTLSHGQRFAVLNNHRGGLGNSVQSYIYEDNEEGDLPFATRSDGPGSLRDFVGEEALGVWLFAMTDDSLSATGEVRALTLQLEPQNLGSNATVRTVPPNTFTFDFIDVPISATNLTVCVASNTEPVELYIRRGDFPSRTAYDYTATIPPGGGCLTVDKSDLPPLTSGRYYLGVFNPSGVTQTILLTAAPERLRGKLMWNPEKCTGCALCNKDCPSNAIKLIVIDKKAKRFVMEYHADRCTYCAQCVQNCRFECLGMSPEQWELAALSKEPFTVYYGKDEDVQAILARVPDAKTA